MVSTWDQMTREALDKAIAQGRAEGRADMLLGLMRQRFGALSADVIDRVRRPPEPEIDGWAARLLDARTPAELFDPEP